MIEAMSHESSRSAGGARYSGFDALRLLAALGVLWSHSYAVRGLPLEEPILKATDTLLNGGKLAVNIFFAISGYLVTKSFATRAVDARGGLSFVLARVLRIMPGLVVCILLTVVACAFVTTLDMVGYWTSPTTWQYLFSNVALTHFNSLPATFVINAGGQGVNGSIWTLRLEVGMYAATFIFGVLGFWKSRARAALVAIAIVFWCALLPTFFVFYRHTESWVLYSVLCYVVGAVIWVFRLSQTATLITWLLVGAGLVLAINLHTDLFWSRALASTAVSVAAIWVGRMDNIALRSATTFGDLSYGIFLYSAPIQQLLMFARPAGTSEFVLSWSVVLSLGMAFLSWRFVESPMLQFKKSPQTSRQERLN